MNRPFALVVEDDEMLATFFASAFDSADYETEMISDGAEALDFLQTHVPAVVLLDLQLPHVSGEELLTFIKSHPSLEKTLVFVTSVEGIRASYLQDEADFVLTKPVAYRQLRDLAARVHPNLVG
ncbi:MAG: response regulator [Anaerolineales bacterium]|nr:response regulator [Anaerolineales bacterium]MCB8966982.1 response regulator [Ardenticatenaceae bacterium]